MIIIYVAVVLLALLLTVAAYSGLFHRIVVRTLDYPLPRITLAYKFGRGPFQNVGPIFQELGRLAPGQKWLAIYYDSPCEIKPENLRWIVGCVVKEGDSPPNPTREKLLANGYREMNFPAAEKAIQTTFPWRNILSIYISISRVWNALGKYQDVKSLCPHPWIEVYADGVIHYIGILDHHADFYVPETGGVVTLPQAKETSG